VGGRRRQQQQKQAKRGFFEMAKMSGNTILIFIYCSF